MTVDKRLARISEMIRRGDRVADIGTDHAYLPVYLVKNGISPKVYACDIADGPLKNAAANIERLSADGIEIRKGAGLDAVSPGEADTFVIAGMGGDMIIDIISSSPWIRDPAYELILQPMTSVGEVRKYLCENGFFVSDERAVRSAGRVYTVIKAVCTGLKQPCEPLFYYIGRLGENMGEDEIIYIKRERRILAGLAGDIENIERKRDEYNRIVGVIRDIDRLLRRQNGD